MRGWEGFDSVSDEIPRRLVAAKKSVKRFGVTQIETPSAG
jgi:hypothetical protein